MLNLDSYIGNFQSGKEADFLVLDYQATPLINYRVSKSSDIIEKLFVLEMLGDDRLIKETWIMGHQQYVKQSEIICQDGQAINKNLISGK